jgi:hypothetical protein
MSSLRVMFPLDELAVAVMARAETLICLGITWQTRPISPNYGKPIVSSEFGCAAWIAEVMIWCTGEAEFAAVSPPDGRAVGKHYDLTGRSDLDVLLDDLIALVADNRIPVDAVVTPGPEASG